MTDGDIKDKILEEYRKGNVCFMTIEGINTEPVECFVQQPLSGILYDLNRDAATITAFLEDPKWVNDLALTKLLEYYYGENRKLRKILTKNGIDYGKGES